MVTKSGENPSKGGKRGGWVLKGKRQTSAANQNQIQMGTGSKRETTGIDEAEVEGIARGCLSKGMSDGLLLKKKKRVMQYTND
jgi:hypothetical protein